MDNILKKVIFRLFIVVGYNKKVYQYNLLIYSDMRSLFRSTFLSSSRFFSSVTIFWVGPVLVDGKIRWCWSVKVLQPFVVSDLLETFSEQTFICVVKK